MTKRPQWEVRVNGIRLSGDVYNSWHAAKEAIWSRINRAYHEAARNGDSVTREISALQSDFFARYQRAERETPRPNLTIRLPRQSGPYFTLQLIRL
jgi:hypothetical protein